VPEQDADVLEVLIGKMGKDRDVDAVLRKCAGVLGQAEPCEPIGYFLHRRPRPAEWPRGPAGWGILPDRSRRAKSTRTVRRRGDGRGHPEEPQTEGGPEYTAAVGCSRCQSARHSGCSGLTNRFRALCSPRRDRTSVREVTPSRLTLERRFTRSDLQKDIAEEQADRLRLLIVVGGHGAFVAAFRNRAEIVRAHVTSISEVAALALAQRPHPLSRRQWPLGANP
jgi:hypothetical protein